MPIRSRRRIRKWTCAVLVGAGLLLCSSASAATSVPAATSAPSSTSAPAASPSLSVDDSVGDVAAWNSAPFVLPVAGPPVVLTPFRPPASRYGPGHRGVDLAVPVGGRVFAAGSGLVVFAGPLAGRGVVSIDHTLGIRTTYEPVTAVVGAGVRVARGQLIGTVQAGHPQCAPASCLHWGARLPDGSYLDPMGLLAGLHVRLLPWT